MSLSALLQQQRQDIERNRLALGSSRGGKPVLFPRDYLSSRQGGARPERASTSMDNYSSAPSGGGGGGPRSHSALGTAASAKSHLNDALSLALGILKRYKREHLKISPEDAVLLAEVSAFKTDMINDNSAPSPSQSPQQQPLTSAFAGSPKEGSPTTDGAAAAARRGRRSSRDLVNKLRGIVHNPQLYKDMVSMRSNVRSLTQFAVECSGKTANLEALYHLIHEQITACVVADDAEPEATKSQVELLVVDAIGRDAETVPLVDIVAGTTIIAKPDDAICQAAGVHYDGTTAHFPMAVDGELFAVARVAGVAEGALSDQKLQIMSATTGISGLSLRTAMQFERLDLQAKKNAEMLDLVAGIASATNTEDAVVQTILESAKKLVDCTHCAFHFVDEKGELCFEQEDTGVDLDGSQSTMAHQEMSVRTSMSLPIATRSIKDGVLVVNDMTTSQSVELDEIERATGIKLVNVLCLPVKDRNGRPIGVAQLSNKHPRTVGGVAVPQRFSSMDETLFSTYASFAAISISNVRSQTELLAEKSKSEAILEVVKTLADSDIRDVNNVVNHTMQGAKKLLHADRSSLFLIDEERNELYSKVADDTGGKEIRFANGRGIAGTVASTGHAEIINDAYKDERFNREVDRQLGYRTRTILAEPITFQGNILAVAQLVNKVDPTTKRVKRFTVTDQDTFRTFALFAGISLSNSRLLEFVIRAGEEAMALNQAQLGTEEPGSPLSRRSSSARIVISDLERSNAREARIEEVEALRTTEFNLFDLRENADENIKARDIGARVVIELFKASGYLERFDVAAETVEHFVLQCRSKYRNVPYHNFFHAVDVVQTIFTFLFHGHAKDRLTDLEGFTLMIAGLCHDLDHMGLNNNFHLKTDSPLGLLSSASGNKSVLEVHHCNLAIEILQHKSSNMFEGMQKDEVAAAYRVLIDSILATDMARHGDLMAAYEQTCKDGYDLSNKEHRCLTMQMLLKAADISNVTKPFDVSRKWAICVTEEFYQQGDREREQGVEVNPMFDRSKGTELAKGQIGFINFIAKKFFTLITSEGGLTNLQWTLDNLERNLATWQGMLTDE